ncbi:MAG: FAD-binding protein [Bacteroidales bacterium]|nr:FAD-binding protein [Candidatus Colimorpha pelethequi]
MIPILTDNLHRIAYATDASAYRELPMGVAYPRSGADVADLIRYAMDHHTCLIPRAGGTSIAGQVVGNGIVVDVSKNLNSILEINAEQRWARVEPGVVRDELNLALKPYGLFFSPETSTSNRCCIGGMVGNNSCGTHSLIYGSTRHHVLQLKGYLSDGTFFDTDKLNASEGLLAKIVSQLRSWQQDAYVQKLISENFPDKSLRRRSCGYAIDEAICGSQLSASRFQINKSTNPPEGTRTPLDNLIESEQQINSSQLPDIDLCKLICGSEGTLCFLTEIKVSLDPLPPAENMVLCAHCNSLEASFEANLVALRHQPVAVELMDGKILELCKDNPAAQKNRFFVEGDPAALLVSEFNGPEMNARADALEQELKSVGLVYSCTRVYGADVSRVWALRKAGLGVLSGMKGDAKPIGVIEDTAVAPERLPAYMADFRSMMQRLGLDCVYYGHISTGELHLRPIINIKTEDGKRKFREVAEETAKLVRKHKGSLSGEHGDGRLRGEFIPLLYGDECYQLMRDVKRCWDPDGVFNVGKITDTPKMDEWLRFQVGQAYAVGQAIKRTYFNWKAAFDECKVEGASGVESQTHALMCSIEQCNGAGDCRKSNLMGGTLCPAFKVSNRDELQATRARANVLREILTNGLDGKVLESPELEEVLYSCLACKGCKGECPSNVDLTRIRAEVLQQIYDKKGTPFRSWMVARMALVERLGAIVPPLYNFAATWKPSATLIKKLVNFAPERSIPTITKPKIHPSSNQQILKSTNQQHTVVFFLDEFTRHQEPELAQTLVDTLEHLGYNVVVPKLGESGRAAISKGCLKLAKKYAVRNVNLVKDLVTDETPLIGLEPSCILSFRDEYPDLVPAELRPEALKLAKNCLLYDEFVMREVAKGHITSEMFKTDSCDIWLHGHCHQKALVGIEKTAAMLRLLKGAKVHVIPSSCCGMAGSFGYEKEHYKTSIAIGEMVLFPAVRKAMANANAKENPTFIAAPGTSCRQQILDGTGVKAVHPIVIMSKMLKV